MNIEVGGRRKTLLHGPLCSLPSYPALRIVNFSIRVLFCASDFPVLFPISNMDCDCMQLLKALLEKHIGAERFDTYFPQTTSASAVNALVIYSLQCMSCLSCVYDEVG